jgi:uncharacterized protein (DUF1330 family)
MSTVEPSAERLQEFLEGAGDDAPVVMVNLLRYRERALYPDGFAAEPCSGREAYGRYGAVAVQRIASVGGRLIWLGSAQATVIGPDAERWDNVVLVEYPSRKKFIEMVSQPEYLAAAPHRTAALEDSRLIATSPGANPVPD